MTSVDRTWASPGRPEPTRSPRELARRLLGEIDTLDCAIYDTLAHTPTPIVFLAGVMLVVAVLVGLDVITYAHQRIGLSPGWLFAALLGSIIGSWFDIPVARLPDRSERRESDAVACSGFGTGSRRSCIQAPRPWRSTSAARSSLRPWRATSWCIAASGYAC